MRIAVLTRHFSRLAGGAESYAVAVVTELSTRHELHVFTQQSDEPVAGVHYHYLPGWGKRLRWLNQLVFAICSWWMTRRGFDVVHAHENTWHGQVQTIHVRPMRLNLLVEPQGWRRVRERLRVALSVRLWVHLALEGARFRLRPGLAVVSSSEMLSAECALVYPRARSVMRVIKPGTEMPAREVALSAEPGLNRESIRSAFHLPMQAPLALFVANDYRRKGLDALLRALVHLPEVHLVVVGSERPVATYLALAVALKVDQRVHFLGPQKLVAQFYRAADVLVHPTLDDTFGMVVLEAMAYGLPVVVSGPEHCGISCDLCTEEHALLLDDPRDEQAVALAVQRVLHDPETAVRLRRAARDYAENFTWESVALQYEALYQQAQAASASR